jgi:DNA-binding SARP family transcriptional activator
MCPRIVSITSSSVTPRATNPHSHRMILAIASSTQLSPQQYCHNVGVTLAFAPPTRIQLCGPTVVERAGERLERRLPGRQGRRLFAYLVLNRHRLISRDELVEALWPSEAPGASANALNALISKLRRVLGPDVLQGRSGMRLLLGDVTWVDVEIAEAAVHRAESRVVLNEWKQAWAPSLVALFVAERPFFPGEEAPWIDQQRSHLDETRLRALQAYGAAALGLGGTELPAAVRAGRQLVDLAPLRETGYRLLMKALAREGNVAEAVRVYTLVSITLRDELGVSPSALTQAVYQQLLA